LGPICGPVLGGWLTYDYNWRWVFYINLPVGLIAGIGALIFMREARHARREPFDFMGFATFSLAIGALQMLLDRGELKDWFGSTEIWVEATISGVPFYLFIVHTATVTDRSFLNRDLLSNLNFAAGTVLMFMVGLIMNGTLVLLPTMLQDLMNYPALTTGLVTAPRGVGSMIAMFVVARMIDRGRQSGDHPVRVAAERGLDVADDTVLALHGNGSRLSSPAWCKASASAAPLFR
jgi:DHA2 family multidrug resistance protein